ncbi:unnamed protein product, partial [marine sediment metagenome]
RVRSEIMNRILSYSKIKLNGEIYKNPSNIISTIKKKNDLFEPEYLYRCHGDLHFANILVSHDYDFMLVDPRGDLEPWDIAYDIGKLIHSCHGLYDFLHTDQFDLKMQKSTFWLDFSSGDRYKVEAINCKDTKMYAPNRKNDYTRTADFYFK